MQNKDIYSVIEEMATNDYPSTGHQPFTYAIVFSNDDFYIGCKYGKKFKGGSHPSMLFNEQYNSNSSVVKERIATESHKRYIIGIGTAEEVTALEQQVVRDLWGNDGRLNGNVPSGVVTTGIAHKGKIVTQETRDKISKANKGKKRSQEQLDNMSKAQKGRKHTQEYCDNVRKARKATDKRNWPQERIDQLISLRDVDKLSYAKIGKIMGISAPTAGCRYHRYKKLK